MTHEFILNEDKERGIKTVGWFLDDGRMHVQTRQYIPDSFFADIARLRESWNAARTVKRRTTQDHLVPLPVLPSALAENLFKDGNGNQLHINDPDRDRILKRIQNDGEYRNLRVYEGRL